MYKLTVIFAAIAIVAGILITPISAIAQSQSSASMSGAFADITTVQDGNTITITITRAEGAPEGGGEIPEVPTEPIIIVPDPSGEGNGTVIVPEPPAAVENVTVVEDEAPVAEEPPVIVIEPEGNATTVTPPSNVTVINNDTVVVAPPDQVVTETPGNVTIIDPPVVTEPAPPAEPCQCPVGVEGGAPDIQAPSSNITIQNDTTIIRPDTEPGSESGGGDNGNGNNNGE